MKCNKMDLSLLRSKFRGTMLGVLAGDCLGEPYQGDIISSGMMIILQRSFDTLEKPDYKSPVMPYTDDSAMTKSLAESLVEKKELNLVDLAKRYVTSYYKEPNRGYGPHVITVFEKLRGNKFSDIETPASQQFKGLGSWGNGGAMRVAPLSLFCYKNYESLLDMVRKQTKLTHTHKYGIDGAILQAIAVHQCLHMNPTEKLDISKFVNDLISKMDTIEFDEEGLGLQEPQPYKRQLNKMKKLIAEGDGAAIENIIQDLGNDCSALYSVPTAIYSFLKAQEPIAQIYTDNPLRRTIQFAISLGGDTDTIGSMAGALAGAFYGEEKLNPEMLKHCEASQEFRELGDKLFEAVTTA